MAISCRITTLLYLLRENTECEWFLSVVDIALFRQEERGPWERGCFSESFDVFTFQRALAAQAAV